MTTAASPTSTMNMQLSVRPELVEPISLILTESAKAAGQYYNFRVPITASACSGESWAATH